MSENWEHLLKRASGPRNLTLWAGLSLSGKEPEFLLPHSLPRPQQRPGFDQKIKDKKKEKKKN